MAIRRSSEARYHAAVSDIRNAILDLDGHLARCALAQVLAEMIVNGTPQEAPICVEHRRHFAEAHLRQAMAELGVAADERRAKC